MRQVMPADKRFEDLTPEEQRRLAAEVNQRLLGIQQGLQIGAAELQRRALAAEKEAEAQQAAAKAAAANTKGVPVNASASDTKRKSSLSGSSIAVNVERNGQVVRSLNAEINLPNVLATVFSTTRRDHGGCRSQWRKTAPSTRSDADKARVASLGNAAKPDGPAVSFRRVVVDRRQVGFGASAGNCAARW
jgi:hypothetical protein